MKNDEEDRSVRPDYKDIIIEKVGKIEDYWILREIYRFIINMTKEGVSPLFIRDEAVILKHPVTLGKN